MDLPETVSVGRSMLHDWLTVQPGVRVSKYVHHF